MDLVIKLLNRTVPMQKHVFVIIDLLECFLPKGIDSSGKMECVRFWTYIYIIITVL